MSDEEREEAIRELRSLNRGTDERLALLKERSPRKPVPYTRAQDKTKVWSRPRARPLPASRVTIRFPAGIPGKVNEAVLARELALAAAFYDFFGRGRDPQE